MSENNQLQQLFSERLSTARDQRGLSQQDLAEASHLQATAISHYETGSRSPSIANLHALADALEVSVDYLLGREEEVTPTQHLDGRCLIGWREVVSIPAWGIKTLIAKIDTGARTSSIHVTDIKHGADDQISFQVVLRRRKPLKMVPVQTRIARLTKVKSSNGHIQERIVVREEICIGDVSKMVDLTLSVRDKMACRMLLGRTALADDFLINVDDKFLMR